MDSYYHYAEKRLATYVLSGTGKEAQQHLETLLETSTLYYVCHKHFPKIFASHFARWNLRNQQQLLPDPDAEQPWSEGELACLRLMEEHLFPFAVDYLEEIAEEEAKRLPNIPLFGLGIDLWNHDSRDPEDGWSILALLNHDLALRDEQVAPSVRAALSRAWPYLPQTWSWEIFKATCRSVPEPLSFLWMAIQMLDHETGNLFLDPTAEDQVEDAAWTLEHLEMLARDWEEAQDFMDKSDQLAQWLLVSHSHIERLVDLWNLATWNMLMTEE
jgi:hypothetical protein